MDLNINPNWTFKEIFVNIRALRNSYEDILCSFSYFELPKRVEFKRKTRNLIYSMSFDNYRKDLIWNYMNHFEYYYVLKQVARRSK